MIKCNHSPETETIKICKSCLEDLERKAGVKIGDTRMNPFTCCLCKKEGDGGISISFSAAFGSAYDTAAMPNEIIICDECFENKLSSLKEIIESIFGV